MKQENADLRRQTGQLPEIISALQEMRQQNAMLHQELQSLKSERGAPYRPVTSLVPSPSRFTPLVSPETSQRFRPIPAPRTKPPTPPASVRELHPAMMDDGLAEDFRNMDISSSIHERVSPQVHYSDPPQPRYSRSSQYIPAHQFETPAYKRMPPPHLDYRRAYYQPPSTQEKMYRGPAPTIPFLTSSDPRELSRLRIA